VPKVYIQIPPPVQFVDPKTKKAIEGDEGTLTFVGLLLKIQDNPKWNQSYKLIKAGDAIMQAFEEAGQDGVMVLADADYQELKEAVESPKFLTIHPINGAQVQNGFGIHPRLSRQILPLLDAIIHTTETDPRLEKKGVAA